jgi:hypothetical protein
MGRQCGCRRGCKCWDILTQVDVLGNVNRNLFIEGYDELCKLFTHLLMSFRVLHMCEENGNSYQKHRVLCHCKDSKLEAGEVGEITECNWGNGGAVCYRVNF